MAEETLQELLLQRLAELERERGMRLTLRQVARRSFGSVTADTLRVLVIGEPLRLTDVQCRGLALALEVPVERIYRAAMDSLD